MPVSRASPDGYVSRTVWPRADACTSATPARPFTLSAQPPPAMAETTARDRVLRIIEEMPSDASLDDVMERVYILQKVERGRQQIAAGQGVPHTDARQQMKRWHA